jgi:hypothetical protein
VTEALPDEEPDERTHSIPLFVSRWCRFYFRDTPFLREFALRPNQTLLINEMIANTRRNYTDGRGHAPG